MPRPKSTGLPREEEEKLRVDALLDVAAEVFLASGLQGASTAEIARRARASKQTLYARFPSKEKLFLAVIERRMSRMTKLFGALLDERAPLRQVLLEVGHHFFEAVLGNENISLLRVIYMESPHFPQIGRAFVESGPERGIARFAAFLSGRMKAGILKKEDPQLAAEHFLSLIHGLSMQRALVGLPPPRSKKQLSARIEKSVDLFLAMYARQVPRKGKQPSKRVVTH